MVPNSASARVLVVDDDQRDRQKLAEIIGDLGYLCATAADGEEALEKLGAAPVDVIISDLMMPRMDGFELLRSLFERGDLTPAIVLTGAGSIDQAISIVHDLHAFWFLQKPAKPDRAGDASRSCGSTQVAGEGDGAPAQAIKPAGLSGGPGGSLKVDARDLLADSADRAQLGFGPDHGRKRHRQGVGGQRYSQVESARRPSLRRVELRGLAGEPYRKRIVRA